MKMIRASGWRLEIHVTFLPVGGVLFSSTDRMGHTTQYTYDGLGRLLLALHDDNTGQGYQYDGQKVIGSNGHSYSYDNSWRVVTDAIGGGETKTYTYYANGSLASYTIQPPSGTTTPPQSVSYPYTVGGQVPGESWSWIPSGSFTFQYTATGQYSTISFPNGQQRRFTYDNQDRLTNITNTSPSGATIASFDYGYDFDWPTNSYSKRGQRTSVSVTAPGASNIVAGLTKYTYDNRYQLVRAGYPNNSFDAWTYDAIGNRLSKTVLNGGTVTPYAYFTNAVGGNTQRLRNDGFYDFTYDADGDVTAASTQYGSTVYGWDHGNRLTSYTSYGTTTYTYDSIDRTSATTNGSTTRYIGMNGNTVGERNTTSNVVTDYIFGPGIDEPLAKRTANGSITYYGVDGLGSVVVSTDPTGAVLNSTGYSPWGEMIFPTPELFGYTGRETGGPSWYYRARHYDASHGRFLSEDPLGVSGDGELYGYALNSPLLFRDPLGLKVLRCWRYLDLATGSALGKPLGGLLLGVVAAIYPPAAMAVPHNTTCLMHEFLYDTDLHTSVGSGPKGVETNETLKGATCREVPNAQGECAMKKFASVQGKYSAVTNNCHSAVQNALDACDECSQKYKP